MLKSLKIVKNYYHFANIGWFTLLINFFLLLLPAILSIVSPVLTAEIIASITIYDFEKAIKLLRYDFLIIVITAILYFIYHFTSEKIIKTIFFKTCNNIYDNVKSNTEKNNINSAIVNDIFEFSKFNSSLLYKLCFFIKSIIILIILGFYSPLASLIIIGVSLVSSLLFLITNKQIQKNSFTLSESKVNGFNLFNSIQKGIKIDTNQKIEDSMREKLENSFEDISKLGSKISLFYNLNNNFITLILKTAVFGLTYYFILLVKSTSLTLPVYLILTPYLTSSAQNLIAFFEIFPEIGIISNIMNEFDELKTATPKTEKQLSKNDNFDLSLENISVKNSKGDYKNISLKVPFQKFAVLNFSDEVLKNNLFNLFKNQSSLNTGSIVLGNNNLENLKNSDIQKFIAITSCGPYFYETSILENLLASKVTKQKIERELKRFHLSELLKSKNITLETNISKYNDSAVIYFLGIFRASLLEPKILCIDDYPEKFDSENLTLLSHILKVISKKCTVLLFVSKNKFDFSPNISFDDKNLWKFLQKSTKIYINL